MRWRTESGPLIYARSWNSGCAGQSAFASTSSSYSSQSRFSCLCESPLLRRRGAADGEHAHSLERRRLDLHRRPRPRLLHLRRLREPAPEHALLLRVAPTDLLQPLRAALLPHEVQEPDHPALLQVVRQQHQIVLPA